MGCASSRDTGVLETDRLRALEDDRYWRGASRTMLNDGVLENPREIILHTGAGLRSRQYMQRLHTSQAHMADPTRLQEIIALQQSLAAMEEFFQSLLGHVAASHYLEAMDPSNQTTGPPPASEAVIASLPRSPLLSSEVTKGCMCQVCCEPHHVGEIVTRLPCGHYYHAQCVEPWLHRHCTCPTCRYELATDDEDFEEGRIERMKLRHLKSPSPADSPVGLETSATTETIDEQEEDNQVQHETLSTSWARRGDNYDEDLPSFAWDPDLTPEEFILNASLSSEVRQHELVNEHLSRLASMEDVSIDSLSDDGEVAYL